VAAQLLGGEKAGAGAATGDYARLERVERIEEVNIATVTKLCAKVEELDARISAQRAVDRIVVAAQVAAGKKAADYLWSA
jgi:hypothetical protein